MKQWVRPHTIRACLFGALLALLIGCNNNSDETQRTKNEGTFETVVPPQTVVVNPEQDKAVVGTVTVIPDTETKREGDNSMIVIGGNMPTLVIDPPAPEIPLVMEESFSFPAPAERFTETAPATNEEKNSRYEPSDVHEYKLGKLVALAGGDTLGTPEDDKLFITPVEGWARFPKAAKDPLAKPGRFPVVVFEHGMGALESYKGYDYLAKHLAAQGYITISINADVNNSIGDRTSQSRGQLVLGTLDRLRQVDKYGQLNEDLSPGPLNDLKGKFDFDRIGIMGHSRGGQGVSTAIKLNPTRLGVSEKELKAALKINSGSFKKLCPELANAVSKTIIDEGKFQAAIETCRIFYAAGRETTPSYDFAGAFMLAPTNSDNNLGLNNVPLAVLLPSCDGDVNNLEGARAYDQNRFGPKADTAPRYQIMVHGANHDFYNRKWGDDGEWANPSYCDDGRAGSVRLSRADQERNGLFLINSFMRYHVGGEQKFAAYWNGHAQLPKEACQVGVEICDERVVLTVQKDFSHRKLIQRFDQADSMERNHLGGSTKFTGFDETNGLARCTMPVGPANASWTHVFAECFDVLGKSTDVLKGFEYPKGWQGNATHKGSDGTGFLSIADHAELAWSKPNASITTDLSGLSAKGTDALTFRIAVVRPMGQEVEVTLTDSAGNHKTIAASDFSDALYNTPGPKGGGGRPLVDHPDDAQWVEKVPQLLNMVAIPLQAFEGVDTNNLKELKLTFPKESGKVAIADIELQNLGRDNPAVTVASKQ